MPGSANTGAIALATKKPGMALDLAMASQRLYPALTHELGMDLEYAKKLAQNILLTTLESMYERGVGEAP